jgi:hypothetical protein
MHKESPETKSSNSVTKKKIRHYYYFNVVKSFTDHICRIISLVTEVADITSFGYLWKNQSKS